MHLHFCQDVGMKSHPPKVKEICNCYKIMVIPTYLPIIECACTK